MESGITLEYLQNLHRNYEEFIQNISRLVPVIKVNWSKYRTAEVWSPSTWIRVWHRVKTSTVQCVVMDCASIVYANAFASNVCMHCDVAPVCCM